MIITLPDRRPNLLTLSRITFLFLHIFTNDIERVEFPCACLHRRQIKQVENKKQIYCAIINIGCSWMLSQSVGQCYANEWVVYYIIMSSYSTVLGNLTSQEATNMMQFNDTNSQTAQKPTLRESGKVVWEKELLLDEYSNLGRCAEISLKTAQSIIYSRNYVQNWNGIILPFD